MFLSVFLQHHKQTETAAAATETAAATTESAEAATETPKPATIPEAAKNLGSAVQNSASQTLQKSKESLQRVRASGQQMANDFVHPQYDDTQKNIVHSAVSGTANLAREVTGHTGSLLGGIASTIMQFGKDIFASGSNTLSRTAQRIGRSRLLKPFIPSQPTNQANNVVPVEQPNELTNGQATGKFEMLTSIMNSLEERKTLLTKFLLSIYSNQLNYISILVQRLNRKLPKQTQLSLSRPNLLRIPKRQRPKRSRLRKQNQKKPRLRRPRLMSQKPTKPNRKRRQRPKKLKPRESESRSS